MNYLQRQRKSVISGTGFKKRCLGLAVILFLLSVAHVPKLPYAVEVFSCIQETKLCGADKGRQQTISGVMEPEGCQQYAVRENYILRGTDILQQRAGIRCRSLQQGRPPVWSMCLCFFMQPMLFQIYGCDGRRRQQTLIPRSLLIVQDRNRADGKKEGILLSP